MRSPCQSSQAFVARGLREEEKAILQIVSVHLLVVRVGSKPANAKMKEGDFVSLLLESHGSMVIQHRT